MVKDTELREKIVFNLALGYEKQLNFKKAEENFKKSENGAINLSVLLFKENP